MADIRIRVDLAGLGLGGEREARLGDALRGAIVGEVMGERGHVIDASRLGAEFVITLRMQGPACENCEAEIDPDAESVTCAACVEEYDGEARSAAREGARLVSARDAIAEALSGRGLSGGERVARVIDAIYAGAAQSLAWCDRCAWMQESPIARAVEEHERDNPGHAIHRWSGPEPEADPVVHIWMPDRVNVDACTLRGRTHAHAHLAECSRGGHVLSVKYRSDTAVIEHDDQRVILGRASVQAYEGCPYTLVEEHVARWHAAAGRDGGDAA